MRVRLSLILAIGFLLAGCAGKNSLPASPIPGAQAESSQIQGQGQGTGQTTLTFYPLPAQNSGPFTMAAGPDGSVWFGIFNDVASQEGSLGRLNADGTISTFNIPPVGSSPMVRDFSTDGRIWFGISGNIGSQAPYGFGNMAANNVAATYQFPDPPRTRGYGVRYSAFASDSNIWYVISNRHEIARVTPGGAVTEFKILPEPPYGLSLANDIAAGPDGALWFTEALGEGIARMTTDGKISNFYPSPPEADPWGIAKGDDGNLWFVELGSVYDWGNMSNPSHVVRMTTAGQMTPFALPDPSVSELISIRRANGGMVFTDNGTNSIGLTDFAGNIVELPINGAGDIESAIQGADGSYYFTDNQLSHVGKITLDKKGLIFPEDVTIAGVGNTQLVGVGILGDRGPFSATTTNSSVATVAPITGFALNFMVTAVGPGTTTLEIKGKGKAMAATVTVSAAATTQSVRRSVVSKPNIL